MLLLLLMMNFRDFSLNFVKISLKSEPRIVLPLALLQSKFPTEHKIAFLGAFDQFALTDSFLVKENIKTSFVGRVIIITIVILLLMEK